MRNLLCQNHFWVTTLIIFRFFFLREIALIQLFCSLFLTIFFLWKLQTVCCWSIKTTLLKYITHTYTKFYCTQSNFRYPLKYKCINFGLKLSGKPLCYQICWNWCAPILARCEHFFKKKFDCVPPKKSLSTNILWNQLIVRSIAIKLNLIWACLSHATNNCSFCERMYLTVFAFLECCVGNNHFRYPIECH